MTVVKRNDGRHVGTVVSAGFGHPKSSILSLDSSSM